MFFKVTMIIPRFGEEMKWELKVEFEDLQVASADVATIKVSNNETFKRTIVRWYAEFLGGDGRYSRFNCR